MAKDDLEKITEQDFNDIYMSMVDHVEEELQKLLVSMSRPDEIRGLTDNYLQLIAFYKQYRADKKDYRINHYLKGNTITYAKCYKKVVGFRRNNE